MEIELRQYFSVPKQEDYTFAQHLEERKIIATILKACQKTDTQMFKSDKHGILNRKSTNTSLQSMEELCEE